MVHSDCKQLEAKNGDKIDQGRGHELQVVIAPKLHWPDTILIYDHATGTALICDAFGMHLCSEDIYDIDLAELTSYHHTPSLHTWLPDPERSSNPARRSAHSMACAAADRLSILFLYVSGYVGFSDRLSQTVAHGIT
eukprot:jgi/Tetstr1/457622/TSEL_044189.t1